MQKINLNLKIGVASVFILSLILLLSSCSASRDEVKLKKRFKNEVLRVINSNEESFSFSSFTKFEWDECIIIGGPYWFDYSDRLSLDLPKRKGIGVSQDIIIFLLNNTVRYSFKVSNNQYELRDCNFPFPFIFSLEDDNFELKRYQLTDQKIGGRYFVFMPDCPLLRSKREKQEVSTIK